MPRVSAATMLLVLVLAVPPVRGAITATGDYRPNHDGSTDPWDLGTSTDLYVGETAYGQLTVDAGSDVLHDDAYLGYGASGAGQVTLSGDDTTWTTDSSMYLGYNGAGSLTIEDRAEASVYSAYLGYRSGGEGDATVTGVGSVWNLDYRLEVGDSGVGSLSVLNGGSVVADRATIGDSTGSSGQVTVNGAGSRVSVSDSLYVGYSGSGELRVEAGGSVVSDDLYVSRFSNGSGTVTVTGVDSTLQADDGVYLGGSAPAEMTVESGATLTTSTLAVGDNNVGTLRVGPTSIVDATNVYVGRGYSGSGTIELDGGVVEASGLLTAPSDLRGTGVINARGLVSDVDVSIASTADRTQQWVFDSLPDQNVTLNLDLSGPIQESLGAGFRGTSTLMISGGQKVASEIGELGYHNGSYGNALVHGTGAEWNVSNRLTVGRHGVGELMVEGGATVTAGSLTVGSASGSALSVEPNSRVAVSGDTLVLGGGGVRLNGGEIETGGLLASPNDLNGTGVIKTGALVTDFDITFDAAHGTTQQFVLNDSPRQDVTIDLESPVGLNNARGTMGAGYRGSATLTIADGRVLYSRAGRLGYHPASSGVATVSGSGTAWLTYGAFDIGTAGSGELIVSDGAHVQSQATRIGGYAGASGRAVVSGAESSFHMAETMIDAEGSLLIEGGASVITSFRAELGSCCGAFGSAPAPTAVVRGEGSEWRIGNYLSIANPNLQLGNGPATLRIEDGGFVSANEVRVSDYNASGSLTVSGVGSVLDVDILRINMQDSTSDDPAVLVEAGGLVVVNNWINILSGFPSDSDVSFALRDGGQLAMSGNREGSLSQFLAGASGDVSYWDGDSYADLMGAVAGVDYTLAYQSEGELFGYTLLTVGELPGLDGDYNGDGVVDAADYTVWRDHLGADVELPGDTTPGAVTQQDYGVWASNYGAFEATEGSQSVPEPSAAVMACLLGGVLLSRARK